MSTFPFRVLSRLTVLLVAGLRAFTALKKPPERLAVHANRVETLDERAGDRTTEARAERCNGDDGRGRTLRFGHDRVGLDRRLRLRARPWARRTRARELAMRRVRNARSRRLRGSGAARRVWARGGRGRGDGRRLANGVVGIRARHETTTRAAAVTDGRGHVAFGGLERGVYVVEPDEASVVMALAKSGRASGVIPEVSVEIDSDGQVVERRLAVSPP